MVVVVVAVVGVVAAVAVDITVAAPRSVQILLSM